MSPKQVWRLLKEAFQEWNQDDASRLAAALAFYTIFSLAPLLIIVIAIASLIFDQATVQDQLMQQVQDLIGESGAEALTTVLDNANRPGESSGVVASLVGVVLLLVGATGVLAQLQTSLNIIWNVRTRPDMGILGFVRKRLLSLGMIIAVGFLLLVSLVLSYVLAGFSDYLQTLMPGLSTLTQLLDLLLAFGLITLLFAVIYRFLPDVRIAWGDIWFGAAVTALLFTLGKFAIGLYLGRSGVGAAYGAAGSVIVLLVWIFYSAQILFFGAEVTQVYARRYGSQIEPNRYAIKR